MVCRGDACDGLFDIQPTINYLLWQLDLHRSFVSKASNNAPGGLVCVLEGLGPASTGHHVLPNIFLEFFLPSDAQLLWNIVPHSYNDNIWHHHLAAQTRENLEILHRGAGHPIIRYPVAIENGCRSMSRLPTHVFTNQSAIMVRISKSDLKVSSNPGVWMKTTG